MTIQDAKTVSDEIEKGVKKSLPKLKYLQHINVHINCITILSYDWQSIRLEGSNRLSINSRIGKVIPKGDNKWEKGKLICIGKSKNMSTRL